MSTKRDVDIVDELYSEGSHSDDLAHRAAAEIERLTRELAEARQGTGEGERIEGFVPEGEYEWFLEQKAEARSTSMEVWTYRQMNDDVPLVLHPQAQCFCSDAKYIDMAAVAACPKCGPQARDSEQADG
jgi:hypothetical protein